MHRSASCKTGLGGHEHAPNVRVFQPSMLANPLAVKHCKLREPGAIDIVVSHSLGQTMAAQLVPSGDRERSTFGFLTLLATSF